MIEMQRTNAQQNVELVLFLDNCEETETSTTTTT